MTQEYRGKQIDITNLVQLFEAKEGDVEHIIGQTGQGKTYEATRRALRYLQRGEVVYTTWRLNLPDHFDERSSVSKVLKNIIFNRKNFFRFEYKKNWHFVNLDDYLDEDGVFDTDKFAKFLATRTDCIFMLDEGQDVFDSHQKAGKIARQSITRTRHMHKKLIIISQRAQAVDVNARGNVRAFYRCECVQYPFFPKFFRVYFTEEVDNAQSYPIWVRHNSQGKEIWKAPVFYSGFARKEVYKAYDSWYMRKEMKKSQEIHLSAYEVGFKDKIKLLWSLIKPKNISPVYPHVKKLNVISQSKERVVKLWHEYKKPKSNDVSPGLKRILPTIRKKSYGKETGSSLSTNEGDKQGAVLR